MPPLPPPPLWRTTSDPGLRRFYPSISIRLLRISRLTKPALLVPCHISFQAVHPFIRFVYKPSGSSATRLLENPFTYDYNREGGARLSNSYPISLNGATRTERWVVIHPTVPFFPNNFKFMRVVSTHILLLAPVSKEKTKTKYIRKWAPIPPYKKRLRDSHNVSKSCSAPYHIQLCPFRFPKLPSFISTGA